jgi:hypothetical protein
VYALRGLLAHREKKLRKALAYMGRAIRLAPAEARSVTGWQGWPCAGCMTSGAPSLSAQMYHRCISTVPSRYTAQRCQNSAAQAVQQQCYPTWTCQSMSQLILHSTTTTTTTTTTRVCHYQS